MQTGYITIISILVLYYNNLFHTLMYTESCQILNLTVYSAYLSHTGNYDNCHRLTVHKQLPVIWQSFLQYFQKSRKVANKILKKKGLY